ncbi:MAG: hypothetical protein AVDCRST_MAG68-3163 [uncultured Gemmatimonadetes bacterium]|uniref:HEPN AbiU2-like domain-containing protein n=1 Tax=uncultured Gemmatimonadota bacterium TaxID=203437 RepID=A0A6J4LVX2_9BACT|nr:MAG: hypothetical protein AVDCRST_MAG68-3163 [uncultured Gemmatimonadota bacterium]
MARRSESDTEHVSHTFREFMEMFTLLLDEANRSYAHVTLLNDQFARRAFVRATFAYIEGVTYGLKQVALLASEGTFKPGELALLKEESYEISEAGKLKIRAARLSTLANIRLAFSALSRSQGTDYRLPVHDQPWSTLKEALQVRHRITHPKSTVSLLVSDAEVQSVYSAGEWFMDCVKSAFAAAVTKDAPEPTV